MNWDIFLRYVLPALLGFSSGIVGYLVAPWIKYCIENKRDDRNRRIQRICRWKEFLDSNDKDVDFKNSSIYAEMRPFLSGRTLSSLEGNAFVIRQGRGGNIVTTNILDDIVRLEQEWGLIPKPPVIDRLASLFRISKFRKWLRRLKK